MKRQRKPGTQRERSSEILRGLRLGVLLSPTLLLDKMGQVAARGKERVETQGRVSARRLARRLPVAAGVGRVVRRPGRESRRDEVVKALSVHQALTREMNQVEATYRVCARRARRREHLFRIQIAGRNRRRSPGRGGTYRRTLDSLTTCRKVR